MQTLSKSCAEPAALDEGSEQGSQRRCSGFARPDSQGGLPYADPNPTVYPRHDQRGPPRRDGGEYVLNGHKWWASGALDPRCRLAIFMGKTDPTGAPHRQQSMVLVPLPAPGARIVRPLTVFGYDDAPHGHAEMLFQARPPARESPCKLQVLTGGLSVHV
jgi:alkylation response protein AidB-like acyl-CoA dehydrogenase